MNHTFTVYLQEARSPLTSSLVEAAEPPTVAQSTESERSYLTVNVYVTIAGRVVILLLISACIVSVVLGTLRDTFNFEFRGLTGLLMVREHAHLLDTCHNFTNNSVAFYDRETIQFKPTALSRSEPTCPRPLGCRRTRASAGSRPRITYLLSLCRYYSSYALRRYGWSRFHCAMHGPHYSLRIS